MKTKDLIIEKAIELFNEKGTKAVSTNHIAAAAGISPGNLYYHFRNKEHIIRAILEKLDAAGMGEFEHIYQEFEPGSTKAFMTIINLIQQLNWEYRFFKRELAALFINDPELKKQATSAPVNMITIAKEFIDASVERGVLRKISTEERDFLADGFCMTNLFWVNYLEIWDMEITEESLARGSRHFLNLMRPYMTEAGLAEIEKEIEAAGTGL